jgi:hypothetical protein
MLLKPENPQLCISTMDGTLFIPVKSWDDLKMRVDRLVEKSKIDPRKDEISGFQLILPDLELKYEAGCVL